MIFFKTNLYRILKNKVRFLVMLVAPVLFILIFVPAETEIPFRVAVNDEDNTVFSEMLLKSLRDNFEVVGVEKDDIVAGLIDGQYNYGVEIERGFTASLINGESPRLGGYSISGTNTAVPVESYLNSFLDAAGAIAAASGGREDAFYKGMEAFSTGRLTMSFSVDNSKNRIRSTAALGQLVLFMLYMSVLTTGIIAEERKNRTFYRIFAAPVSMKRYMGENLLSFFCIAMIQLATVFALIGIVLNLYLGESAWHMILLFTFFAVVCIAFGLMITSYSKTPDHANLTVFMLATPMVMLGGAYWPRDYMPGILVKVGDFIPVSWVMSGAEKLLYGGGLESISRDLLILAAFAGVFFLAGVLRRVDIAR